VTFVDIGDMRFHVQRLGPQDGSAAGTVVLVHGVLTDSLASYYFTMAPAFAAAGLDVVMYDQRGHGRSSRPGTGYQLERFVGDLDTILDRLGVAGPVHLMGNSFGGTVALGLAAHNPGLVGSVFLIESEPATGAWATKMAGNLARAKAQLPREETIAWIANRHGAHTARLARAAARLLGSTSLADDLPASATLSPAGLRGIRCPVLAVYGAESDMVSRSGWLDAALPDCRSTFVAGQEHSVLVEATDTVRELFFDWLNEQGVAVRAAQEGRVR
jgi:pimeloyl-ACP methyl ester carboxylesterase